MRQYFAVRNVFPLRAKPLDQSCGYAAGWRDGCAYGERITRWKGLVGGVLIGLAIACATVALVTYFGGR